MVSLAQVTAAWHQEKQQFPDRSGLADIYKRRYLRSYLLLRVIIGSIGLALPIVVWLGSALLPDGHLALRGSLSAYYYSGMREFFTCALAATGVFLMAYKLADGWSFENTLTFFAGLGAVLVAFFPTDRPSTSDAVQTPLQKGLGETTVATIHFVSAIGFIVGLALISHLFATWEGRRTARPGHRSPQFWRNVHNGCALAIVVAGIFYAVRKFGHLPCGHWVNSHDLWLTEVVSVAAFGLSWLLKGAEIAQLADGGDG